MISLDKSGRQPVVLAAFANNPENHPAGAQAVPVELSPFAWGSPLERVYQGEATRNAWDVARVVRKFG